MRTSQGFISLEAIAAEIRAAHDVLASSTITPANAAWVQVWVDDGLQDLLDDVYGPGVVQVEALLQPVD